LCYNKGEGYKDSHGRQPFIIRSRVKLQPVVPTGRRRNALTQRGRFTRVTMSMTTPSNAFLN
jgi:hypothetical protein